jgi:hypothetical protein
VTGLVPDNVGSLQRLSRVNEACGALGERGNAGMVFVLLRLLDAG